MPDVGIKRILEGAGPAEGGKVDADGGLEVVE